MSHTKPPAQWWICGKAWTTSRYPCRCKRDKACWTSATNPDGHPAYWCPCWGRTDLDGLPRYCCAPGHPVFGRTNAEQPAAVVELELAGVST